MGLYARIVATNSLTRLKDTVCGCNLVSVLVDL